MTREREWPPRLLDLPGPAGECLRQALAESRPHPGISSFEVLRQRRQRRVRQRQALVLALCTATGVAASWLIGRPEKTASPIAAEVVQPGSVRQRPHAAEVVTGKTNVTKIASSTPPPPKRSAGPSPRTAERTPASTPPVSMEMHQTPADDFHRAPPKTPDRTASIHDEPDRSATATPQPNDTSTPGSAKTCAELARGGASEQAMACYEQLALGNGITAELALFEQARLAGKMLHRPELALTILERCRARFPQGSLKGEVMLAMIDGLLALGDKARALDEVDRALASGLVRERRAELIRLRETLSRPTSPIRSE